MDIRALRTQKGLTIAEVAAAVGMDRGNLSKLERGLIGISTEQARKLAGVLECTVDEVVGGPIKEPAS